MKTFAISVTLDARITVTDDFVAALRNASVPHPEDLTFRLDPFLAEMNAMHENDDAFVKAVLANGIRKMTRLGLVDNLHNSGVVATVAPATIAYTEVPDVELSQEQRAKAAAAEADAEAGLNTLLADLPGPSEEVLAEVAAEVTESPVEQVGIDLLSLTKNT